MLSEDLVRMANQIARFFAPYPEADAIEGVRDHLVKFWDPAMRRELLALAGTPANGLDPIVLRAIAPLMSPPMTPPMTPAP
jgi:formate dehydrogenase subunit delta